jgi:hypothetical protein
MALFKKPTAVIQALNFKSARKKLAQHGVKALLPSLHPKYKDEVSPDTDPRTLPIKERVWHPAMIPSRHIAVLRKRAIRTGTYGTFDPVSGEGWDEEWDVKLAMEHPRRQGRYMFLRVPKQTAQQRSREQRALNIEAKMEGMDSRMEELQASKHRNKPVKNFMWKYNKAIKSGSQW